MASPWSERPWHMAMDTGCAGGCILRQGDAFRWYIYDLSDGPMEAPGDEEKPSLDYLAWVKNGRVLVIPPPYFDNESPMLASGYAATMEDCKDRCRDALAALGDD